MIGTTKKFKIAHLLGSTKGNEQLFRAAEAELTKQGYICFAPVFYGYEACKPYLPMLTEMCTAKLQICDICVVATPDHIGDSTTNRIKEALSLRKPVYLIFADGSLKPIKSIHDLTPYTTRNITKE